jgi:periplasmic protein TonB
MTEAQPVPTPDGPTPVDETPHPTPPTPAQTAEELKPEIPPTLQPQPQAIKIPDLPKKNDAEAMLAPPPPPPLKPEAHKERRPKAHEAERKKPIDPDKPKQRQTSAPPSSVAARPNTAAAPSAGSGASPSVSPVTWKSELMAHLNRYKRYPAGASSAGTASVAFTIARSGQVVVRAPDRLVRQSGAGRRSGLPATPRQPRSGLAVELWRRRPHPHRPRSFRWMTGFPLWPL